MAPTHHYNLVNDDSDDTKAELDNSSLPPNTPSWKHAFYLLLAASAGLGAAFGVVLASSLLKPSTSIVSEGNATSIASACNATTNTPLSADIVAPAPLTQQLSVQTNKTDPLEGVVLDCGWSPEEARAKGCVYDVMMQDWVPEPCYDGLLTERYLARGNYTWYADIEGTVMSDEEMRKGNHREAWMSGDYHKDHCIFSWEKLIRAMRNNKPISQELVSYDHVLHCHHQTLGEEGSMRKRDGAIGVRAPTNYAKCALYSTWKADFIPDKHPSDTK
ncbi:hypothetical protein PV08_03749 [Exophiala spinifera]|uniref:Uncharacterized protein n=1 Tax=Exophiala spinifera TaxID=91928 RepID=A0A0D1YNC0_9EURO|nr:uncharacterized protein PV08_03749 [Exophiala spinifera]KIW16561.1 hypothetical protein PV08_03749 [Exophiala spinifera]